MKKPRCQSTEYKRSTSKYITFRQVYGHLSQPKNITILQPVSSYTTWWQRHIGVNNLPKVVTQLCPRGNWTHNLLIASPLRHCTTWSAIMNSINKSDRLTSYNYQTTRPTCLSVAMADSLSMLSYCSSMSPWSTQLWLLFRNIGSYILSFRHKPRVCQTDREADKWTPRPR